MVSRSMIMVGRIGGGPWIGMIPRRTPAAQARSTPGRPARGKDASRRRGARERSVQGEARRRRDSLAVDGLVAVPYRMPGEIVAFTIPNPPESDAASPEALRATIADLEARLSTLHAEREADAARAALGGDGDDLDLVGLYEDKLRAGGRLNAELRERVAALEAQLAAVQGQPGATADPSAELAEFRALQERAGGRPLAEVVDAVRDYEAQLAALHAERGRASAAEETAKRLAAQVAALLDEKEALEATLARAHTRTRAIVAALVDQSFATG